VTSASTLLTASDADLTLDLTNWHPSIRVTQRRHCLTADRGALRGAGRCDLRERADGRIFSLTRAAQRCSSSLVPADTARDRNVARFGDARRLRLVAYDS
jgi:hypothetical protein